MKHGMSLMVSCFLCLLLCPSDIEAKKGKLVRFPDAVLLVGYGPTNLHLTTPTETLRLQPTGSEPSDWGHHVLPSLSLDGKMVASARLTSADREVIATYLISEKKWTEYTQVSELWSVSISPNGTKLAFVSEEKGRVLLRVLDTTTGLTSLVVPTPVSVYAVPTWSPDGNHIAYQVDLPKRDPRIDHREFAINVVELSTAKTWKIANGQNPSWSPSGEWIAYLDTSGNPGGGTRCMAVRPDGNDVKTLVELPRGLLGQKGKFVCAPVWSPSSKKLLLNEIANWEAWTMNIDLLDLTTHKLTRKIGSGVPVLGWAEWK
ncbi:MAG: hypothetical protein AABO41_19885 [Acidobacteriota bacterium]